MRYRYRATVGVFSKVTGLLMRCVSTEKFTNKLEARDWAIAQLDFYAPSPYMYEIKDI